MTDLALKNATTPQVKELAIQIKDAQGPEIETMTQWLQDWGMGAAGTMSEEAMQGLAESQGAEFDQLWLQRMIAHHEGAITMAQQVLDITNKAEVTTLANDVVKAQQVEIESMQELLTQ